MDSITYPQRESPVFTRARARVSLSLRPVGYDLLLLLLMADEGVWTPFGRAAGPGRAMAIPAAQLGCTRFWKPNVIP